ncbi:MAG: c-type cytochrome [Alphaproteobacteria bacterium]|nr:c-type cytochrome [Alphaproteobacteria bacterium]
MRSLLIITIIAMMATKISYAEEASHNMAMGEKIFIQKCAACHSFDAEDDMMGPHLKNIIGRKAGSLKGMQYSPAMKKSGIIWNRKSLNQFIKNPAKLIPNNKMSVVGINKLAQRKALIDYLIQQSKQH